MSKVKFNIKKVVKMFREKGITRCEVNLPGCERFGETPAHRKKRRHYTDYKINAFEEILIACPYCHDILEKDPVLTASKFKELRG